MWTALAVVGFALFAAGVLAPRNVSYRKRWPNLAGFPAYEIGSFRDSTTGTVVGRVEASDGTIEAPLSGEACVFWEVEWQQREYRRTSTFVTGRGTNFTVVDETGTAIVKIDRASVRLVDEEVFQWGGPNESFDRERLRALIDALDLSPQDEWRFVERKLVPGVQIAVTGYGVRMPTKPDEKSGYREMGTMTILSAPRGGDMYITDDPRYFGGTQGVS